MATMDSFHLESEKGAGIQPATSLSSTSTGGLEMRHHSTVSARRRHTSSNHAMRCTVFDALLR